MIKFRRALICLSGLSAGYLPRHRMGHLLKSGDLIERKLDNLKSKIQLKMAWCMDAHSHILD